MDCPQDSNEEFVIKLFPIDGDHYSSRLETSRGVFEQRFPHSLPASIREDLRLLRWKAIGLKDEGDKLLPIVGQHIADLILPPQHKEVWGVLVETLPNRLRVNFQTGTDALLHLPWELFRVNDRFVLQDAGSQVIRELPTSPSQHDANWGPVMVHVSLGLDPVLRLDEERSLLVNALPENCSATFLLNPSIKELELAIKELRPSILVVSGHGRYDDISESHSVETLEGALPTDAIIRSAGLNSCGLLLLWTCESARFGPVVSMTPGVNQMPVDTISFSYPVQSTSAIKAAEVFFGALFSGESSDRAMSAVRAAESDDVYSFFNIVHYHSMNHDFFRLPAAADYVGGVRSQPCNCREVDLLSVDLSARESQVTTVLAPVGSGADSLLAHWHSLNLQSASGKSALVTQASLSDHSKPLPPDVLWVVVLDPAGTSNFPIPERGGVVRWVAPFGYRSEEGESIVLVKGVDREAAIQIAKRSLGPRFAEVADHPLLTMPGFLTDLGVGMNVDQATEHFETENHMYSRHGDLGEAGREFASLLFIVNGRAVMPGGSHFKYARSMQQFGENPQTILEGLRQALRARVVFQIGDDLVLSPDFLAHAEKWFPTWRTDHLQMFRRLVAAFATLVAHGKVDIDNGEMLLAWATAIHAWKEAALICVRVCVWYGQEGRLDRMEPTIKTLLPHIDGEEKLILEGNLASILTSTGRYSEALTLHGTMEERFRAIPPTDDDHFRNLGANLTQQVSCLVSMGELEEALGRLNTAKELVSRWPNPDPDAWPRLFAQRAQIQAEAGHLQAALESIGEAITRSHHCPDLLRAEFRCTKCDILRRMNRIDQAEKELEAVAPYAKIGELRSRYLHLKGLLLEGQGSEQWIEHLLESYEHDKERGNLDGVAISLLTLARIFIDQGEIDRAKDRLREAIPYIEQCGLTSSLATYALLRGEVELASGQLSEAQSWFSKAKHLYDDSNDDASSEKVNRLLQRLA